MAMDNNQRTALNLAQIKGHQELVDLLLKR